MRREPESFEDVLAVRGAQITKSFNAGDAEACAMFYTEDATLLVPDRTPIKGREAIQELLEDYIAAGTKLVVTYPDVISSSGELGYCTGNYQFDTPAVDGSTETETGQFVTVFRLQADGSWKAVIDSLIRDAATGP